MTLFFPRRVPRPIISSAARTQRIGKVEQASEKGTCKVLQLVLILAVRHTGNPWSGGTTKSSPNPSLHAAEAGMEHHHRTNPPPPLVPH